MGWQHDPDGIHRPPRLTERYGPDDTPRNLTGGRGFVGDNEDNEEDDFINGGL